MLQDICLSKNDSYRQGVNTLDSLRLHKHLEGSLPITDKYGLLAADINDDKRIDKVDLLELRKLVLGITDTFQNNSWRFPIEKQVIDKDFPFAYIEQVKIELDKNIDNLNFVAIKIGDLNGDVNTNIQESNDNQRINRSLSLIAEDIELNKDEVYNIPIYAHNLHGVLGYQMTMKLKNARFITVDPYDNDLNRLGFATLNDSIVTLSSINLNNHSYAYDQELFTIRIKSNKNVMLSELLSTRSEVTKAEVYFNYCNSAGSVA